MRASRIVVILAAASTLPLVALTPTSSYLVRSLTALVALVAIWRFAVAPGFVGRLLLCLALLTGLLGGVVAAGHLLVYEEASPPGAAADWLYLCYGPLAAAGLLALPRNAPQERWRLKTLADAGIAAAAMAYVLAGQLRETVAASDAGIGAKLAALGYPADAVFVLAVLLAVLPRVHADLRPFLRVVGAGLVLMTLSDLAYSVGTLHGWYTPTTWPAVTYQAGVLVVAIAPMSGRRPVGPAVENRPASLLEASAAYAAIIPVLVLTTVMFARGESITGAQLPLASTVGLALLGRQLMTNAEHRRVVRKLRTREQEALAEVLRDPLTGLANRGALHGRLNALLHEQDTRPIALALLDLDDFKDINDTHGHDTGDEVLREIARRLEEAVPPGAMVARLGGDEFAVCVRTSARVLQLGQDLTAAFNEPVVLGARHFAVTASIGVILADAGSEASAARALSHADVAMYQAKASKAPLACSLAVLAGSARDQAAAKVRMRDEVSRPDLTQFRMVYEPVVDLADGHLVGCEALLRWQHPVLGPVGPTDFIALAEQVGAIAELGEFALRTALAALAGWLAEAEAQGQPLEQGSIGVNLSPRQLGVPGLCDLVRGALAEHGLAPYRLVLEITEQALMDDWATAVEVVRELRSIGVGVAVDDFGTGYSSLRYLRRFDTSTVKIDREFVQAVADEPRTRALVASVLDMARSLDLYTVAEGIETLDQLTVLRTLGCRFAQGHLFDQPLEKDAFGALLLARHRYPMPGGAPVLDLPGPRPVADERRVVPSQVPVVRWPSRG